ncbi:ADR100Cp [Eremothecium gossypii ATCC 10895]|uniref:ADR100Cp n=1 Tax=Eremothecium gossypii (strain ATCC 10895 / CBS 109.51 / FGSC 9923 / NRRL Y-1056) TaxID=284811 RepID=Q75AG9_EREGS|nr:ADR100Cp [Eremothecium gossypii ATCC 10895]AAS52020.1 ADR100Cp [Eremothecium gossypii ATCC 10895]AEY96319.1 FADR100Cp [Eremothecium gossypii FDAG1]
MAHHLAGQRLAPGYPPLVKTKRTLRLIPLQNSVRPRAPPLLPPEGQQNIQVTESPSLLAQARGIEQSRLQYQQLQTAITEDRIEETGPLTRYTFPQQKTQ